MEVFLPNQFSRDTMYDLITQVIDRDMKPVDSIVVFNFNKLRFIRPAGVTVLSNLVEWLIKRGVDVKFALPDKTESLNRKTNPIKYLDDSLFFNRYIGYKYLSDSSPRETTLPLQLVAYGESYNWLKKIFSPWLLSNLSVNKEDALVNVEICIQEIFNNIKDHAQEDIGCIFIQNYPKEDEIIISISDFGVGIPYWVKATTSEEITDSQAIEKAIENGFSTKSTVRNAGAGLDILICNVVLNNEGSVYIHSNYGILICRKGTSGLCKERQDTSVFYPGTLFEIRLRTDILENSIGAEEEFKW